MAPATNGPPGATGFASVRAAFGGGDRWGSIPAIPSPALHGFADPSMAVLHSALCIFHLSSQRLAVPTRGFHFGLLPCAVIAPRTQKTRVVPCVFTVAPIQKLSRFVNFGAKILPHYCQSALRFSRWFFKSAKHGKHAVVFSNPSSVFRFVCYNALATGRNHVTDVPLIVGLVAVSQARTAVLIGFVSLTIRPLRRHVPRRFQVSRSVVISPHQRFHVAPFGKAKGNSLLPRRRAVSFPPVVA